LSAILPAAVAALNGLRFQTECQRLAERSEVMRDVIKGRLNQANELATRITNARLDSSTDAGTWTPEVLRLAERIATEMVNDAADWSVLYTRTLAEP
jgi:hypothetical protein